LLGSELGLWIVSVVRRLLRTETVLRLEFVIRVGADSAIVIFWEGVHVLGREKNVLYSSPCRALGPLSCFFAVVGDVRNN